MTPRRASLGRDYRLQIRACRGQKCSVCRPPPTPRWHFGLGAGSKASPEARPPPYEWQAPPLPAPKQLPETAILDLRKRRRRRKKHSLQAREGGGFCRPRPGGVIGPDCACACGSPSPRDQRHASLRAVRTLTESSSKERSVSRDAAPGQRGSDEVNESCTQTIPNSEETGSGFHARFRDCRENQNGELEV